MVHDRVVLAKFSASDIGDPSVLVGVIQTLEDGRIGFQNGRTAGICGAMTRVIIT